MASARQLPSIADTLGPILERVPRKQRPIFIAMAERMAAERYREWAGASQDPLRRAELLACAEREEEIAGRVEALYPECDAIQADLLAKNPGLTELNRALFADRSLADQYAIQAQGERVGAATWRAFAEHAEAQERKTFLDCADLEEQSAAVLESLLESADESGSQSS